MRTRAFFISAIALSLAAGSFSGAIGDELQSKGHPSPEPFGDIKPFDLSKRQAATNNTDVKKSETTKESTQPDSGHAFEQHPKIADEILKVNDLGDPERIVFEGVKLFSEKQLRLTLACDLKYQAAARPSNELHDFVTTLEKRLTAGYQHSGCPDATVFASRDSRRKVIVAKIIEGSRYRKGEIHVTGSKMIDEQAVREILTKPQRARAWEYIDGNKPLKLSVKETSEQSSGDDDSDPVVFWKAGEAVDFYKTDRSYLERAIQFALAELGFVGVSIRAELERDKDRGVANLQISILDDKPQAVVGDVEVSGLKRDSREALLNYLKVAPNDPLNCNTLQRIDERLSASCRYWTRKIEVLSVNVAPNASYPESVKPKLKLTLEEYAPAPPLGQPLSDIDEALKKCSDWVNSLGSNFGGHDLVCTAASADLGGFAQHTQVAMAADGTIAIDAQFANKSLHIDHSAVLGGHSIEIYDWQHADKLCFSRESLPILQVRTHAFHTHDGKQDANLVMGYAFGRKDRAADGNSMRCDIRVDPVVLLDISRRGLTKAVIKDGVLTLSDDTYAFQIDQKTGQILSVKIASFLSAGILAFDLRSESNFVPRAVEKIHQRGAKFEDRCDSKQPFSSGLNYAIDQIERQPAAKNSTLWSQILTASRALANDDDVQRAFADVGAAYALESDANDHFSIPGHVAITMEKWSDDVEYYAPFLADKLFPRGTWPWTYAREFSFLYRRADADPDVSQKMWKLEQTRLNSAREYGPTTCLILAHFQKRYFPERPVSVVNNAKDGLSDLSDEAFLKDVRYLTDGDRGLAVIYRAIAKNCDRIAQDGDDDTQTPFPSAVQSALGELAARRGSRPDEPIADAARAAMLEAWHKGWKDGVERELRSLSAESVPSKNEHAGTE